MCAAPFWLKSVCTRVSWLLSFDFCHSNAPVQTPSSYDSLRSLPLGVPLIRPIPLLHFSLSSLSPVCSLLWLRLLNCTDTFGSFPAATLSRSWLNSSRLHRISVAIFKRSTYFHICGCQLANTGRRSRQVLSSSATLSKSLTQCNGQLDAELAVPSHLEQGFQSRMLELCLRSSCAVVRSAARRETLKMVAGEATLGWLLPAARSYKVDAMYDIQHYVPGDGTFGAETGGRHHPTRPTRSFITRPHDFHYSPRHPAFLVTHKSRVATVDEQVNCRSSLPVPSTSLLRGREVP